LLYVVACPTIICLSTQPVEIFDNVSMPFGILAMCSHPGKILRRSSQGKPSVGGEGVKRKRDSQIRLFWAYWMLYLRKGATGMLHYRRRPLHVRELTEAEHGQHWVAMGRIEIQLFPARRSTSSAEFFHHTRRFCQWWRVLSIVITVQTILYVCFLLILLYRSTVYFMFLVH